jgi:hypothetical protein
MSKDKTEMKGSKREGKATSRRVNRKKESEDQGGGEIVLPDGDRTPDRAGGEKRGRSRRPPRGAIEGQKEGPTGPEDEPGLVPPSDEVLRDIVRKAKDGDIDYQKLYLKYIDLIRFKLADEEEVIYEATFVEDKDKDP